VEDLGYIQTPQRKRKENKMNRAVAEMIEEKEAEK